MCIKTQLEEIDCANDANRKLFALKDGSPSIYKTRIFVTNGLCKKLKELMMEFQVSDNNHFLLLYVSTFKV